jgi:hypothetical protein
MLLVKGRAVRLAAGDKALEASANVTLAGGNFKVAVDDTVSMLAGVNSNGKKGNLRDGKKDTSTAAQGTEEVGGDGQTTNAGTTEGSGSGDNTLELLVHALFTVTRHDETLVLELLGNVTGSGAGNLNPGLGEEGAGNEHEGDVNSGVDGVEESLLEVQRRRHVVGDTGGSVELGGSLTGLPHSEELDKDVVRETGVQHLTDQEDVGAQSGLQHDGHVGGVEEADGVGTAHATLAGRLDGDLNTEALQVDDSSEDEESGQEVHDVGQVLAVECLVQGTLLVGPGQEKVEESDDGTLELGATAGVDGRGGEGLPDNGLANVGGNEQGDTTAQTVALLEELIQQNDNQTSNNKLNNQENTDTGTKVAGLAVETSQDVNASLAEGEDDSKQLLGGLVELAIGLEVKVDVDEVGTGKELEKQPLVRLSHRINCCGTAYLEDHAGGDDGGDTQLHQSSTVTGKHHTEPVQGVRGVGGDNAVKRHLTHDQEDHQSQL